MEEIKSKNSEQMPEPIRVEPEKNSVEMIPTGNGLEITYRDLDLNAEHPITRKIEVTLEKQPISLIEGKSYAGWSVLIDKETEEMKALAGEAEALKIIPEAERARSLMELLRGKINYAYNDDVEKLSETDPDLAKWVAANTGLDSHAVSNVPLSKLIENKYGVCRHLAVAYLWLASKADLKGVVMCSDHGKLKNILRTDNGEKLFKSAEVGGPISAHSWVEIKTSEGRWIPIDPSTKLVGDNEENLEMFKQANYKAIGYGIDSFSSTSELQPEQTGIEFSPGEPTSTANFWMRLKSSKPVLRLVNGKREEIPATNTPYSGEGGMLLKTGDQTFGIELKIIKAENK